MAPTFVDKENAPPKAADAAGDKASPRPLSATITRNEDDIRNFQKWWSEERGDAMATSHALLRIVDANVLQAVISAGAGYHNCLGIPELDNLLNQLEASEEEALEPLRQAMRTKGGAKNQARAVGTLLFGTARSLYETSRPQAVLEPSLKQPTEPQAEPEALQDVKSAEPVTVVADEIFDPPRRFICSESFPPEATVAVRLEPNKASSLVTSLPYQAEVLATASRGTYLQFKLESENSLVWVPRVLDGLVLFVEKDPCKQSKEREEAHVSHGATGASTEEAIQEQQEQVERCQSWWAEGHGATAAVSHSILSVVDAAVLAEVIAAGANYHNCLSADRLDALQRSVSKSNLPGLEALRRALQSKGGAKSQARAVGSVIFKEAMEVFKNPEAARQAEPQALQDVKSAEPVTVVADEIFDPPRRFICSESFPPEATVAVRAEPSHQGQFLSSLPHGTEVNCSGRVGDFLQFQLEDSGSGRSSGGVTGTTVTAYVPLIFRGLQLFIPDAVHGDGCRDLPAERLKCLEERVEQQDAVIRALQAELSAMRAHMTAVATAFGTLR